MLSGAPATLEAMEQYVAGMNREQRRKLTSIVQKQLAKGWLPQIGPQTQAYYSDADETLYGGAAGGGKTDLLLGLATTAHQRSAIFRRQSTDLATIWNRLEEIAVGRIVKSDAGKHKMRLSDGRFIEFGHLEKPGSEKTWQGNPHDLYGFDEAAQLDEFKVAFVIQWLRSTTPGQRKRVVFATNPPIPEYRDGKIVDTGTGAWLKEWFAPWIDDTYPYPAQPGELRWCFMRTEGDRLRTVWVEGPGGYRPETGERVDDYTEEDVLKGLVAVAISRTFIRSLLENNAFLKGTGYAQKLSTTPEPLKSLLLNGSFTVKGEDHPFQVIPTLWILEAQARWRRRFELGEHKKLKQLVLSADIAQGGMATTVLAPLLETDFFDELVTQPGSKTPTGKEVVQLLLTQRRDGSLIVLDATGGWGGSTRDKLTDDHGFKEGETLELCVASHGSTEWVNNMLWKCLNARAEMWWLFREALDIKSGFEICLPPSTRLATQLAAPLFILKGRTLQVEEKADVMQRIGSSTDEADAVIQAWHYRDQAISRRLRHRPDIVDRIVRGVTEAKLIEEQSMAVDLDDPLREYRK